jgi:hypothetical protein
MPDKPLEGDGVMGGSLISKLDLLFRGSVAWPL